MDGHTDEVATAELLQQMGFSTFSTSVLIETLKVNKQDVDRTIDDLLTMKTKLDASVMPARAPAAALDPSDEVAQQLHGLQLEQQQRVSKGDNAGEKLSEEPVVEVSANPPGPSMIAVPEPAPAQVADNGSIQINEEVIQAQVPPLDDQVPISLPIVGIPAQEAIAVIYFDKSDADTEATVAAIRNIFDGLLSQVKTYDLSHDYELAGFIKARIGSLSFPVAFVRDDIIGGIDEVNKEAASGDLKKRIDAALAASGVGAPPAVRRDELDANFNVLDKTLSYAESVLTYLNPLSWFRSSTKSPTDSDIVEFDVVQSNWYWRHQLRKLRFAGDLVLRVHPSHNDIRAAHQVNKVEKVTVTDANNLVIRYTDGSSPDWIRCKTDDLPKILELFKNKRTDSNPLVIDGDFAPTN